MEMRFRIISGVLLMVAFSAHAAPNPVTVFSCAYWDKSTDNVEKLDKCVEVEEGKLRFLPALFAKTSDVEGMSWVGLYDYMRAAGLMDADYYVRSPDSYLPVVHFDNGPDWFVEGLVRSRQNGKVGYWDDNFRNRIAPQFDYAWQFKEGKALVCNGCKPQKDGEHTALVGGEWFYIDKSGQKISDVKSGPF
ncbi:WG repeat-containing protein [Kosakonia quasisacchari]|uniref:WG repeat-containing protein n=2 Tax=Kosakonia quasisacchari TaxID=2529380 RepID=A0A4V2LYJ8_9ENTR|nr:WG repeat-containing protein [Kosakonia quasisacchari]